MPNWCYNVMTLKHSDPKQVQRIVDIPDGKFLDTIVPIGEWDWERAIQSWGTKWDVSIEIDRANDSLLNISFDSAWAPPIRVLEQLTEEGYEIDCKYYEPGVGFVGQYTSIDGDVCYDIPSSSEEVEQVIPNELDELFGISEYMREQEEQELKEELDELINDWDNEIEDERIKKMPPHTD